MNNLLHDQITIAASQLRNLLTERERLLVEWFPDNIPDSFPSLYEISNDELLNEAINSFLETLGWLID